MVKFGLFDGSAQKPSQEYEGDFLNVSDDIVRVLQNDGKGTGLEHYFIVAVVRLALGQSVKKV
jgi:hypothetical protein